MEHGVMYRGRTFVSREHLYKHIRVKDKRLKICIHADLKLGACKPQSRMKWWAQAFQGAVMKRKGS